MVMHLDMPVAANGRFDYKSRTFCFEKIYWEGREYEIKKLGYHHVFRRGRTLFHVYSVAAETIFFRLILDTETLGLRVTEVSDGESFG